MLITVTVTDRRD